MPYVTVSTGQSDIAEGRKGASSLPYGIAFRNLQGIKAASLSQFIWIGACHVNAQAMMINTRCLVDAR